MPSGRNERLARSRRGDLDEVVADVALRSHVAHPAADERFLSARG
jgi:hypothetical protein